MTQAFSGSPGGIPEGAIPIVIDVPGLRKVGPIRGAALPCQQSHNMSKGRPVLLLSQLSLHFVRFREVSKYEEAYQ